MHKWCFNKGVQGNYYLSLIDKENEWIRVGAEEWDKGETTYKVSYMHNGKWCNYQSYLSLVAALYDAEGVYTEGWRIDYRGDWR